MKWFIKVLRHYADFSGRARRKEYWMFVLFNFIFLFVWTFVAAFAFALAGSMEDNDVTHIANIIYLSYMTCMLLPGMAVSVRRLHDLGKSGWWLLIMLIPFGGIWLFILMVTEGQIGDNRYGPDPKTSEETFDIRAKLKSAGIPLTLVSSGTLMTTIFIMIKYKVHLMYYLYNPFWLGWLALLAAGILLLSAKCDGRMHGKERIVLYLTAAATALFVVMGVLYLANADEFTVMRLINQMISLICDLSILTFFILLLFAARNKDMIHIAATVSVVFCIMNLLWTVYYIASFVQNVYTNLPHLLIPVAFIVLIRTLTSVYTRQDTNSEYKY
jgi:uncharacterized membrane protein YhaH (DUF805 family)